MKTITIVVQSLSDSEECELGRREIRKVYLITYSKANISKIPTRKFFAEAVIKAFHSGSANVLHWCCSQESHKKSRVHYHMCLKLDRNQRWLRAKNYLNEKYGISVHFSSVYANYYTAWKYVNKDDEYSIESEGHPDLNNSEGPSTSKAYMANRNRRIQRDCKQQFAEQNNTNNVEQIDESPDETESKKRGEKRKRLSAYEVSEIILSKRLRNRTELLAFSTQQRQIWPSSLSTEVS